MTRPVRIALALALVPLVALGLARFAYGLLLPPMRDDLGWTYGAAGGVTTANAVGYLAGAIAAPRAVRILGGRTAVVGGVAATAAMLALNAATGNYLFILFVRFAAGLTSGIAFVAGGVLAAGISRRGAPNALTWYPAGAGAGIAISAVGIPPLVDSPSRWPVGWILLGALCAVCAIVLAVVVPAPEEQAQTAPAGKAERPAGLWQAELAYGLFGLGYIAYVTFVVAYLRDGGASSGAVIGFWFLIGIASLVATQLWPPILRPGSGHNGLALTLTGSTIGVVIMSISRSWPAATLSALFFGASVVAVVSAATGLARDLVPEHSWTATIARLTILFGVGQTLGPILAGLLGDTPAGLRLGLGFSAATLALATAVAWSRPTTVA